jgi:hypothetical protein
MKPMIWHPEEKDARVNQYLSQRNHAPYFTIAVIAAVFLGLLTVAIFIGSF